MPEPLLQYPMAVEIAEAFGTPVYIYDEKRLLEQAAKALSFESPFGLTVRYAMKACSTRAILRLFNEAGLHFDASSGYEVERLLAAGIHPDHISLSTQELPRDFAGLVRMGVSVNACSLRQLDLYGQTFPKSRVGLRFNPGLGSGGNNRTNVGGPSSSFGIWHAGLRDAQDLVARHGLTIFRIHTHIGSGSDPEVWKRAAGLSLRLAESFPDLTHFNLGGGYKVARVENEQTTEFSVIAPPVADLLQDFADRTGRKLHLEIEPGTYLTANAGAVLARVQDVVDTGPEGYTFLKLDSGMTEILRPSLYGAQHPVTILQETPSREQISTIVVGHCCESGDLVTPAPADPESLAPRKLPVSRPGDFALIGGAGAYCSSMSAKNYNSFPEAAEVLIRTDGRRQLIRRRQTLDQMLVNEC